MELSSIQLDGERHPTPYYLSGRGVPLLYLHHLAGMSGWEPVPAELARNYTVVAPYAPGFGPARGALYEFDTVLDLVLHFAQLLDELEMPRAHVVGHSFGGWLAAELAAIQPQRVGRVVLVNPVGLWDEKLKGEYPYGQQPSDAAAVLFAGDSVRARGLHEETDRAGVCAAVLSDLEASTKFLWPLPDTGVGRRLRLIKAPTLIVTSGMDRVVPAAYGDRWWNAISESSLVTIPDAGHLVNLEQPERMAAIARHFLSGGE